MRSPPRLVASPDQRFQRNGDDTDVFELALKMLEKTFSQWPDSDLSLSSIGGR